MNKKGAFTAIVVSFLLIIGVSFVFSNAKAYSSSTHSFLTEQIADLYNKVYDPDLTKNQINQLVLGSVNEDTAPRWINHFYDPITGKGWLGKRLGTISEEQVRSISKLAFGKEAVSALNWVHNQELQQNSYYRYEGNRTFESAILFYTQNQEEEAFKGLGYVLHSIEDMAVPAHTRQDSHFDMPVPTQFEDMTGIKFDKGEPYENWVTNQKSVSSIDSLKNNYQPICYSLDECLTVLSQYSNSNFFSSDTILDGEYKSPNPFKSEELISDGKKMIYYYDKNNNLLYCREFDEVTKKLGERNVNFLQIHQSYWDRMAPKAILAGVEVVKYFQDQAEQAKNEEIVVEKLSKPSLLTWLTGISLYGEFSKIYNKGKEFAFDFYNRLVDVVRTGNDAVNRLTAFFQEKDLLRAFLTYFPPGIATEETIFSEEIELPTLLPPDDNEEEQEIVQEVDPRDFIGVGGPILGLLGYDLTQEELDDIAEKLDIIKVEVEKLMKDFESTFDNDKGSIFDDDPLKDTIFDEDPLDDTIFDEDEQTEDQQEDDSQQTTGGGSSTVYPKILISEVQVSGLTDQKQEFVELYNPNNTDVDLTNWYLHKKTKTGSSYSSFASSTLFSGKTISSKGYFLIARQEYFTASANIFTESSLAIDNSLILKNPNGEISDKVGWGQAQDYELLPAENPGDGQSIGRKWISDTEQDTDINSADFELQTPTPKLSNITYVIPPTPGGGAAVEDKDTSAPLVNFSLGAIQTSLTFTINFDITDPITTVSPSGIDSYVFKWKQEGGDWQQDALQNIPGTPEAYSGTRDFTGQDQITYYFQIKTKDAEGNESDWQPETPIQTKIDIPKIVLINEVQTAGLTDQKEEFVELYNPTAVDIDLTGWYLQKKTKTATSFSTFTSSTLFSGKTIKSKKYLLISREESSFSSISDIITSYALADDNTLAIKNSDGDIVDKVGWGQAQDYETASAANPPAGQSIQRKWDNANNVFQDTNDNSADFEINASSPKPSAPKSYIEDKTDYSSCIIGSNGIDYYRLSIEWSSPTPNLDFYDLQYKVNNASWQDWILQTTDTEKTYDAYYSMFTDYVYSFRVRVQDTDGNLGDWVEIVIDLTNPVVINEIALYGTNSSRDDQWIELYNRSDYDVDLTNWKFIFGSLTQNLQGIIPAKGYIVLEAVDDNSISDILASQILSRYIGGSYSYLINQNNRQIDRFYIPSQGWPDSIFKDAEENYYSIERISPYAFGSDSMNWKRNNGQIINGTDRSGGPVYGTPGQQNSNYQLYTVLTTDFSEDTNLPLSLSPYLIHDKQIWLYQSKVLTIDPGVIIKFHSRYAGLTIEGTLNALGTTAVPIVFTSFVDDTYGGDIDRDNGVNLPTSGSWIGLIFTADSNSSQLENIVLRYAGYNLADRGGSGIRVDQSSILLANSTIEKNLENGILLNNSSSNISFVNFLDNEVVLEASRGGRAVHIQGGSPQIANSYFNGNRYGVYIDSWWDDTNKEFQAYPTVSNNNFENNETPIQIDANCHPSFANNIASGNNLNAIVVNGSVSGNTTWNKDLIYVIESTTIILENSVLTIDPGVIMKFYDRYDGMEIRGTLSALGTIAEPIVFTSFTDDAYGGDTDQDNGVNAPEPGSWLGLHFTDSATDLSQLDNIILRYGGDFSGDYTSFHGAGIKADQVAILLTNSIIENNSNNGIWLINSDSVIDTVQVLNNQSVSCKFVKSPTEGKGIYVQGGSSEIKNSYIWNNHYGLYIDKWIDLEHVVFLANVLLSNNSFGGNNFDIWDTANPPPGP